MRTKKPIVIAALSQLVADATANGAKPTIDGGFPTFFIEIDEVGGYIKLGKVKVVNAGAAAELFKLIQNALAEGVKPRKDRKGAPYTTLEFSISKGVVEVATS